MGYGIERNAPCPCGSGKKYKRCCLSRDRAGEARTAAFGGIPEPVPAPSTPEGRQAASLHDLDEAVAAVLLASLRDTPERAQALEAAYRAVATDARPDIQLMLPWMLYHAGTPHAGRARGLPAGSVAAEFVDRTPDGLSATQSAWVEAQRSAWLSIWEAQDVVAGQRCTVEDLLTGERRTVEERSGTRNLPRRAAALTRVIDHDGISIFAGTHPEALPPGLAAEVVREVRRVLGLRAKHTPPARLRSEAATLALVAVWESACRARAMAPPPRLQNTDGDPLCLVRDTFALAPGAAAEARRRLATLEGADPDGDATAWTTMGFARPGAPSGDPAGTTIIGRATLREDVLTLETNSLRRADTLRRRVAASLGALAHHQDRRAEEIRDVSQLPPPGPAPQTPTGPPIPAATLRAMEREILRRHYTAWLDQPVPALRGRTPRTAAANPRTRGAVETLLKEFEFAESRRPDGPVLDVDWLRAELGLQG